MNKIELKERLIRDNVPEHFYSLEGGFPYDAWCLAKRSTDWEVYYTERGEKYQEEYFSSEEEACNRLYQRIKEMMDYNKS